jgi:hypothetical protein
MPDSTLFCLTFPLKQQLKNPIRFIELLKSNLLPCLRDFTGFQGS